MYALANYFCMIEKMLHCKKIWGFKSVSKLEVKCESNHKNTSYENAYKSKFKMSINVVWIIFTFTYKRRLVKIIKASMIFYYICVV